MSYEASCLHQNDLLHFYSSAWRYEGGRVILDDKRMHTVPWIVVFGKTELIFVQILW